MIAGNATDFIDKLSYEDHYALFQGKKYFFNGCRVENIDDKAKEVRLSVYEIDDVGSIVSIVFDVIKSTITDCLTSFEEAPIWNGKSFWEVEQEMQWVDE